MEKYETKKVSKTSVINYLDKGDHGNSIELLCINPKNGEFSLWERTEKGISSVGYGKNLDLI